MEDIRLLYMVEKHVDLILNMDGGTDDSYPWTKRDFKNIIEERSCVGKICKQQGAIVAYTVSILDDDEINILKLCVQTDRRRSGIGRKIINQYKKKIQELKKFRRITSVVKENNLQGQLFLKENGFVCREIVEQYFEDFSNGYQFVWTTK